MIPLSRSEIGEGVHRAARSVNPIDKRVAFASSLSPQHKNLDSLLKLTLSECLEKTFQTQGFMSLQEKFGRFRVLIVGRANAGKTTILQGICNSTEYPEIYDGEGNRVRT